VFIHLYFALKVKLKDLKFEFFSAVGVDSQINIQLTYKISLKFDFSSSCFYNTALLSFLYQ